jgi:gliding motility-associated-like protein
MKLFQKKITLFFLLIFLLGEIAFAQITNNGNSITIQNNAILFVDGNFSNLSGSIFNYGNLSIKGNWVNNDNNGAFNTASNGIVNFLGANQTIGGTQQTNFPSVYLAGSGIKKLLINTTIKGNLDLTDREFALEDRTLNFTNTQVNGIVLNGGIISTDFEGVLNRSTKSVNPYLFPLGSKSTGSLRYRPLYLNVKDSLNNVFGATFLNRNPSNYGYSTSSKRHDVDEVNQLYFHILNQPFGESFADFNFYYDHVNDGDFNQLVNWIKFNLWEKAGIAFPKVDSTFKLSNPELTYKMTYSSIKKITELPMAFSYIQADNDPITFFNTFSPDGDGTNDRWEIKNIDLFPNNQLTIMNRWGSEVFNAKGYSNANAWDGGRLNNGTYYYLLRVNINGEDKVYKGFLTRLGND